MLERTVKAYLLGRCKELGIYHRKFTSPGCVSVPDWILINNGKVVFLELKATGKVPTIAQWREIGRIIAAGGTASHASSVQEIEFILSYLIEN